MLTQELLEFIGNNPRLQMLQTLHKAIARGKVNLAVDVVAQGAVIVASNVSSKRKINEEGCPYNKYYVDIRRGERVWRAKVCIADLVHFLMLYCPHISQAVMPPELIQEVERTSNQAHAEVLASYLNDVLFQDYRVICSTGMREYFVLTAKQKSKQLTEIVRYSSLGSIKEGSKSPSSFSRQASLPDTFEVVKF